MGSQIKITAFCPTLNRPELLGRMIACFEHQTYENRELIILDDGGQYENQKGDRWELISVPRRLRSLGEKNNAVMALASFDSEAYAKADDDDVYHPWWLESLAEALQHAPWVVPHLAIDVVDGERVITETHNRGGNFAYHGCWGYRRELIEQTGGYFPRYAGDDGEYQKRLNLMGMIPTDIDCKKWPPFYEYNRPLPGRISTRGHSQQAYIDTGKNVKYVGKVPTWTGDKVWERPIPTKVIQRRW